MAAYSKPTRPFANLLLVPLILVTLALQLWLTTSSLVAEALTVEGSAARNAEAYEAALQYYQRAHRWNPRDVEALFALGNLRQEFDLYEAAEVAMSRGVVLAPYDALRLTVYANLLYDLGQFAQADALIERAQSLAPAGWKTQDVAGLVRVVQGDYAGAAAHFERALAFSGHEDPDVLNHLANAYFELGRLEEALREVDKAVMMRNLAPDHRLTRGKILLALDRAEEASKDLGWAERVYRRRGDEIHDAQRKLDETRRYYVRAEAARKWPDRAVAVLLNLAQSEGATKDVKELAEDLRKRLDTIGGHLNIQAQYDLGRTLFIAEDYEGANLALMRALNALPDEARIACTLLRSQALVRIGNADQAVELLRSLPDADQQSAAYRIALEGALSSP